MSSDQSEKVNISVNKDVPENLNDKKSNKRKRDEREETSNIFLKSQGDPEISSKFLKNIKDVSGNPSDFLKKIDFNDIINDTKQFELWRSNQRLIEKKTEPLLDPKNKREFFYPIKFPDLYTFYKLHKGADWSPEEIDLAKDDNDWNTKLNKDEQHFIKWVLAFFSVSDFIINENEEKENDEIVVLEDKFFNTNKIDRENTHIITYANLLEQYVKDENEKEFLKNAIKNIPAVKKKAELIREYIKNGTYVERCVLASIAEGIFFSGSFCSIYWLRKRGLMPGLCDSNELIARDEGIHRDYNCYKYREYIVNKLPKELVIHMIKKAVEIEKEFILEALPVKLMGMNSELMGQYIEYIADHLYYNLTHEKIYNVEDPFSDWMKAINLKVKTDFFIHRPTDYAKVGAMSSKEEIKIRFDEEF